MLSEVDQVVIQVLRPVVQMISYFFVLIAIIVLLMWVNPIIALSSTGVMGILYMIVYFSLRKSLGGYGVVSVDSNKDRFKSGVEAISGIKNIKVFECENIYLKRFHSSSYKFKEALFRFQIFNQSPKFLLEALAFGGIILLTIVILMSGDDSRQGSLGTLLPMLGLYAFSAYRLQPALTSIYQGVTSLSYGAAAVDNLLSEVSHNVISQTEGLESVSKLSFNDEIEINNLSYKFPNSEDFVLNKINLTIKSGSSIGIIGGSGAGKTTLLDLILGLLTPTNGFIAVDKKELTKNNLRSWRRSLGYIPHEVFISDSTIAENIAFGVPKDKINYKRVIDSAKKAKIHDFIINNSLDGYEKKVGDRGVKLSGGQKQRIGIARALYRNPDVLILDEATSALDPLTEKSIIKTIQELSGRKTIIIVTHKMNMVKYCDTVVLLEGGIVKESGTYKEISQSNNAFFDK